VDGRDLVVNGMNGRLLWSVAVAIFSFPFFFFLFLAEVAAVLLSLIAAVQ
jgi:hypothetical protein